MKEVKNFDEYSDISFNTREISVFNVIDIHSWKEFHDLWL